MPLNKVHENFTETDKENYIGTIRLALSNSDNGWINYADTAGTNPTDGIGGTPGSTLTQNTTNPLSGLVDFRFTKDASNRQGEGFSYGFSITNRHLAKVLQITFDTELISGTYASGDLRVSIIQDPTGTPVLLEPVNTSIQLGIVNQKIKHVATFQTHLSITSYRLCIHVSSTSSSAYTVDFNNFRIWEPPQILGSVITDWQLHTLTASNTQGIGTPTSEQNVRWRRVGSNLEMRGNFRTGTVSANELRINFPSGLVANIPTNAASDFEVIGYFARDASTSLANFIAKTKNGFSYFCVGDIVSNTSSNPLDATGRNGSAIFSSGDDASFYLSVPIAGWGSNVVMSSDSGEGRVVIGRAIGGSSATVSTGIPFHFTTTSYDSHSGFTRGTAGNANCFFYTAPISGYYRLNCCVGMNSTNGVSIFVNDIDTILLGQGTNGILTNYSGQVFLNAGQKIDIRPNSGSFTSVANANNFFSIERVSAGFQVIGNTETVNLLYTTASNSHATSGSFLDLIFGTRVKDSHLAYNTSTGIFTAPVSGTYSIYAQVSWAANATGFRQLSISNIGNTDLYYGINLNASALSSNNGFCNIELNNLPMLAGEQIKIRYFQNSTGTLALVSGTTYNRLSITRVGSY